VGLVCSDEMSEILFGSGFGVISDLKNGPNGWLYVISLTHGRVYRIGPNPGAFPDADGDGVNDACDCAPAERTAFSNPGEVPRLRIGATAALTQLTWDFMGPHWGSTRYTLVSGDLSALRYDGAISRACAVGTNLIAPPQSDTRFDPSPGYGYFYLVRGGNFCGPGTYGDGSGTPDPRDALDATTVLPVCGLCSGRAGGALITFSFTGFETLRVWITNGPFIDRAKEFLATGTTQIPVFYPLLDGRDCDSFWTWHPDPATPEWADSTIEVCDGHPSDVESDKPYWFGIGFCPWSATVIAVEDSR
ncbi:MAG TPA: hypothetical protein VJB15_06955, partial [Rhodothermia bacterium]|nr:hypothetical protein [Rhodothermia bacterium]